LLWTMARVDREFVYYPVHQAFCVSSTAHLLVADTPRCPPNLVERRSFA
jgi:hypothetical protein